jgi:hypothetical protein
MCTWTGTRCSCRRAGRAPRWSSSPAAGAGHAEYAGAKDGGGDSRPCDALHDHLQDWAACCGHFPACVHKACIAHLTLPSTQAGEVDVLLAAFALAWRHKLSSGRRGAEAYPAAYLVLIVLIVQKHVYQAGCQWMLLWLWHRLSRSAVRLASSWLRAGCNRRPAAELVSV